MPWQATYTRTGANVFFTGTLTLNEILEAHGAVHSQDYSSGLQYILVDLTAVTGNTLWAEDIKRIADLDRIYAAKYPGLRMSFITQDSELLIAAASWGKYMKGSGIRTSVWPTRSEALDWLRAEGMTLIPDV